MPEQLSNEKKRLILDAARKRFAYYGFSKVTMDEIASDLGMGKASLYYYFPTKDALYEMVLINEFEQFANTIESIIKEEPDPKALFREFTAQRLEYFKNLANLRAISFNESSDTRFQQYELFRKFQFIEVEILQRILKAGDEKGVFDIKDTKETALLIVQMLFGARSWNLKINLNNFNEETYLAVKAAMNNIAEIILNGIIKR